MPQIRLSILQRQLSEMLEGLSPKETQWPCRVRTVLGALDAQDAEILRNALLDLEMWPASTLAKALRQRGVVMSDNAIARHRKGFCSC